ncbi:uncharacterized protein LOC133905466 [Phragmites australis]|uniref:uncharacterized protein LOC133905466 n=1 Tax=Phragmites australis TaxID=29695 RepID=UPI002D777598|nr:uncharacterized protein LOC133905466 [Phragmites australis]XP_062203238.1 uncharacterized protein LOC133905466 [Phragmites australis]XP_062203239.1 uncharacterized protein LOC133905466 [Phragmites australis]XP_062203240.1 uncharacterized protein LOC133905466 [Phragmites australis]XP_062203241.1 uncharacterized protein LOC133905466 [Phragmites australis]XP_062203242.1 uncharacterized protein LOC133905466 [Phragmites australis]XP_062203243.1 uncharacterized protein LOC133905466 [Phragmites a
MDPRSQHLFGGAGREIGGTPEMEGGRKAAVVDFSVTDAKVVCNLVRRNESVVRKKRRYLLSMSPGPDGHIKHVKRPKFMKEVYVAESYVRGDELSCERVRTHVERCFGLDRNGCNHHIVQDGIQLFNLQKEEDGSLTPNSLKIMHRTINKLSLEALHSVACIVTHNRISFEKTGPRMKNIIKDHLRAYLSRLDNEDSNSQLSQILTNLSSYQSDCVTIATPVTPRLLTSLNQALAGLKALPMQALVAMNRKLREESCPPRFGNEGRAATSWHIAEVIKKRCDKIISKLGEGIDLPKHLAKAMSVVNLCRKEDLRCMDISHSEFFPFSKQVISLQNDVLNALWSLEEMKHDKLKLLRPILHQSLKDKRKNRRFSIDVRHYLVECLFECDEGNLPDKALQVIAFFHRMSRNQAMPTEETKEAEIEAVLNLSSQLRAVTCYDAAGDPIDDLLMKSWSACPSDDHLINLDSEDCSKDNDFILTETNYFNFGSQQNVDEPCSSNSLPNAADMSGQYSSGTIGGAHCVPKAKDFESMFDTRGRCRGWSGYAAGVRHFRDSEAAGSVTEPHLSNNVGASNVETTRCSKGRPEICDETAVDAHKLIGLVLENMLLPENKADELTGHCLGEGCISQGPQALVAEDNQSADIVINAVKSILPNLSKSCIEKVRRILNGGEQ